MAYRLLVRKTESADRVQVSSEATDVHLALMPLGKSMNPIPPPVYVRLVYFHK